MDQARPVLAIAFASLAVLAALAGAGCRRSAASPATSDVAEVKRGQLQVSITAVGNLSLPRQARLAFGSAGTVSEVSVALGDVVKSGAVLARLDTRSLEQSLLQAQSSLKSAEINLKRARDPYTAADREKSVAAVGQAAATLAKAEQALQTAKSPDAVVVALKQAAVNVAEGALLKAKDDLSTLKAGPSAGDRARAEAAVQQAAALLRKAQSDLSAIPDTPANAVAIQLARADVAVKEANLQVAQESLDTLAAGPSTTALARGQATVDQAQAALDVAEQDLDDARNPDPVVIMQRQAETDAARGAWLKAKEQADIVGAGADPDDVAIKEAAYKSALASAAEAQRRLDEATLRAPFDGVVADVNVKSGELVGSNTVAVRVVDTSLFETEVLVDELDIRKVSPGLAVQMTLDALPNISLPAEVKASSPTATIQGGVVNYRVVLGFRTPDSARTRPGGQAAAPAGRSRPSAEVLREGLTVTATIVVAQRPDVLLVPSRALSRQGARWTVTVVSAAGTNEERTVGVGESAEGFTEITDGLSEGEKVLIRSSRTATTPAPTPRPPNPPGGLIPRGIR